MSLAMYAAPFENVSNEDNNEHKRETSGNLIHAKKHANNKTQKRPILPSEKVSNVLKTIHDSPNNDAGNLGDFVPIPPPNSVGVENTIIRENMTNNANASAGVPTSNQEQNYYAHLDSDGEQQDDTNDVNNINNNYMNTQLASDYYKKYTSQNFNSQMNSHTPTHRPSKSVNNRPYYSPNMQQQQMSGDTNSLLLDKLNYMINLLEEQQDEKTNNVTEEVVLYSFLGIFIIFIVDSFARAGKYVR